MSPLIDKYCVPPRRSNTIRSTGNYLFVRFVTSNAENLVNFKANIKINDCGGSYYVFGTQEFSLPNYPNNYSDNMECIYYFRSYSSNYDFNINITSLDIIANSDCSSGIPFKLIFKIKNIFHLGDYVELREESATGNLIGRYCGQSVENSTISLKSENSIVYMIFKSDTSQTGKGLKITFKNVWSRCGATIDNAMGRGLITSPKYPDAISEGMYCMWYLFAPPGRSIKLTFLEYNLKVDPRNNTNCLDQIRVRTKTLSLALIK